MHPAPAKAAPSVTGPLFVPTLHGIRAFGVLLVVLFHVGGAAEWTPAHAFPRAIYEAAGPIALYALFFTSGFVLFLPTVLTGSFGSIGGFGIRRFARMGPPYYVCMLLVVVLFPLLSTTILARATHFGLDDFLIHASFLQRELSPGNQGFHVNSPVWPLSVDLVFYVVLPLIASRYLRHPLIGLVIALAASMAWRTAFIESDVPLLSQHLLNVLIQPPLFIIDFASGMTGAWAFVRLRQSDWPRRHVRMTVAVAIAAMAALVALAYFGGSNLPYHLGVFQEPAVVRILFPLVLLVFAVAMSSAPSWTQWPLTNRPLLWFSEISYSVLLYHFPIIFFGFFTLNVNRDHDFPWLWTAYVLPSAIAVGTLSYFLIERPSRRCGRRLARRLARAARPEPPSVAPEREAAVGFGDSHRL